MVRLYSGASWQWAKLRLKGNTIPAGWEAGSPTIVRRKNRFRLHTPIEKKIQKPQKATEQAAANPDLRVCAVDLNINDTLAVCTILKADGTEVATCFVRGGRNLHARRRKLLGRVARNRRKTGVLAEGEQDNTHLWRKINAIDDNEAHRVSRRIVDFAAAYGAAIIVFEHLGKFRPQKGCYSKRGNQKRAFWLKGKIVKYARYKARELGILTCRVSPAFTSQDCSECGHRPVARYAAGETSTTYRPGAPLFFCPNCGKRGNADKNATVSIGLRFFHKNLISNLKEIGVLSTHPQKQIQPGGQDGLALPSLSLAKVRLPGRGYATRSGQLVYAGVAKEAHPL